MELKPIEFSDQAKEAIYKKHKNLINEKMIRNYIRSSYSGDKHQLSDNCYEIYGQIERSMKGQKKKRDLHKLLHLLIRCTEYKTYIWVDIIHIEGLFGEKRKK